MKLTLFSVCSYNETGAKLGTVQRGGVRLGHVAECGSLVLLEFLSLALHQSSSVLALLRLYPGILIEWMDAVAKLPALVLGGAYIRGHGWRSPQEAWRSTYGGRGAHWGLHGEWQVSRGMHSERPGGAQCAPSIQGGKMSAEHSRGVGHDVTPMDSTWGKLPPPPSPPSSANGWMDG